MACRTVPCSCRSLSDWSSSNLRNARYTPPDVDALAEEIAMAAFATEESTRGRAVDALAEEIAMAAFATEESTRGRAVDPFNLTGRLYHKHIIRTIVEIMRTRLICRMRPYWD